MRRTRHEGTVEARVYAAVVTALVVGYPLLGLVYLTDRLGTLVEPLFFVAFSAMVLTELFEPIRRGSAPSWAERPTDRLSAVAPEHAPVPGGACARRPARRPGPRPPAVS